MFRGTFWNRNIARLSWELFRFHINFIHLMYLLTSKKLDHPIYSISMTAPIFVSASFNFSASSFDTSSLTRVGQLSTNFLACTRFIPSNRLLISLIRATFCLSSNLSIFTLKAVWTFLGAASSSSSAWIKIFTNELNNLQRSSLESYQVQQPQQVQQRNLPWASLQCRGYSISSSANC